jgi:hypothetical protein
MSTPYFTSQELRAGASALIASRDPDRRIRFVQRRTGMERERAESLISVIEEENNRKQARTRAFVDALSSGADEAIWPVLTMHGLITVGTLALGAYIVERTGQWFLGVVCVGVAAANVWVARGAYLRRRARARRLAEASEAQRGDTAAESATAETG